MAADEPRTIPPQDRLALAQRNASEVGAMVAAQVREAVESAERSAGELQKRALDRAASDHDAVDRAAAEVIGAIDAIEAKLARLLQDVRDEVAQIAGEAKSPEPAATAGESAPPAESEPAAQDQSDAAAPDGTAQAPRRRMFGRRRRAPGRCDVCGRAPRPGDEMLEEWQLEARMSLCPECRADGWRLPRGGAVPYRATAQSDSG